MEIFSMRIKDKWIIPIITGTAATILGGIVVYLITSNDNQEGIITSPSQLEFAPDHAAYLATKVSLVTNMSNPSETLWFTINNVGLGGLKQVQASIWAITNDGLNLISKGNSNFIAKSDNLIIDDLTVPRNAQRFITCVSFRVDSEFVEVMEFFTPEKRGVYGQLSQYREAVKNTDPSRRLCSSMPNSAAPYI
jgi:hypothetical protein